MMRVIDCKFFDSFEFDDVDHEFHIQVFLFLNLSFLFRFHVDVDVDCVVVHVLTKTRKIYYIIPKKVSTNNCLSIECLP